MPPTSAPVEARRAGLLSERRAQERDAELESDSQDWWTGGRWRRGCKTSPRNGFGSYARRGINALKWYLWFGCLRKQSRCAERRLITYRLRHTRRAAIIGMMHRVRHFSMTLMMVGMNTAGVLCVSCFTKSGQSARCTGARHNNKIALCIGADHPPLRNRPLEQSRQKSGQSNKIRL